FDILHKSLSCSLTCKSILPPWKQARKIYYWDPIEVDPRVGPVIEDVVRKSVREDVLDHVTADRDVQVTYETLGGLVQRFHDHTVKVPVHWIQVIESEHRLQGHRITRVDLEVTTITERISTLERDNTRLRGMLDVESKRVDRLQRGLLRAQRELSQIHRFRFYDRVRLGRLDACARRHLALKAYDTARNPKTKAEIMNEQQDDHVEGDVNTRNGNENGNRNPNVNTEGVVPIARECTYQDLININHSTSMELKELLG
nr:hypothetical protein [Tanacetum cinerariifolium]